MRKLKTNQPIVKMGDTVKKVYLLKQGSLRAIADVNKAPIDHTMGFNRATYEKGVKPEPIVDLRNESSIEARSIR